MLKTQLVFSIAVNSPRVRGGQCLRSRHRGVMLWVGFPAVPDAAQSKTPRDGKDSKEAASDDQDSPGRKTQLRDKGRKDYLKLPLSPPAAAAAATGPPPPPLLLFLRPPTPLSAGPAC